MKRATIYRRKGGFFVHASSRTTDGVWILDNPCLTLDEDSGDDSLGLAIRAALDGSRSGVVHPRTWTGLLDPLLKQAGTKSWGTFVKTAKCAEVEEEGSRITVIPTRNLGVDEGFEPDSAKASVIESAAAAEVLGANARSALE